MDIKIKYHVNDLERLDYIGGEKSDWIDLRCAEDTFIPLGSVAYINLGISMQLPEGYEAHVAPRSSTPKKFGIVCANSFGIIDNSYCGDNDVWKFPAICIEGNSTKNGEFGTLIHKNDRICQFRIFEKQPTIQFKEVETLGNTDRGGFGSTGKN